jgi:4-amino-4-deoxy-L-arabinose transferase-like glycosyltransferase
MTRSLVRPLALIIVLAMLVRLAWVLFIPNGLYADSEWYFEQGVNLANNQGYLRQGVPTALWPVGYPFFLSLVFRLTGPTVAAGQFANVLLLGVDVALIAWLAWLAAGSRLVALGTAAVVALAPTHIVAAGLIATEPLYAVLIHAQLLLLALALRRQRTGLWLLNGVWAGLTAYVRSEAFLLLGVVLLFYGLTNRPLLRARRLALAAAIAAAALVVILPWGVRNTVQLGLRTPFSTNSCMNLWIGNNSDATGGFYWPRDPAVNPAVLRAEDTEQSWYQRACAAAVDAIRSDPLAAVRLWPQKMLHLWENDQSIVYWAYRSAYGDDWAARTVWPFRLANLYYFAVLGLGLIGIGGWLWEVVRTPAASDKARQGRLVYAMLLTSLLALTLAYLPFFGDTRFHFVLMPVLALFGVRFALKHFQELPR